MDVVAALIVLAALAIALFVLGQPLWPGREQAAAGRHDLRRADLDAAKVAKYREIRDAELDHATGKLSDADWQAIDRRLRADAVEILHELDGLGTASEAPEDLPPAAAGDGHEPVAATTGEGGPPDAAPADRL